MLQTDDIGEIFAQLQAAYGRQWTQGADAIPVWQRALKGISRSEILAAVPRCVSDYPDYPPSLGQFKAVCLANRPRATKYLPAPKESQARRLANLAMFRVLINNSGVDNIQLTKLKQLNHALVEEIGDDLVTQEWADDIEKQMGALADAHDKDLKASQMERAREAFRVRHGMQ
jgi:hypothetical protein